MTDVGELIGGLITALVMASIGASVSGKNSPLVGVLMRVVNGLAAARKSEPSQPNGHSDGNGNGYRRLVEEQGKRLDMTGDWMKRLEEKIDELARKGRLSEDTALYRLEQIRRAIDDRFTANDREFTRTIGQIHARLTTQDEKIEELLSHARSNGNGHHD